MTIICAHRAGCGNARKVHTHEDASAESSQNELMNAFMIAAASAAALQLISGAPSI